MNPPDPKSPRTEPAHKKRPGFFRQQLAWFLAAFGVNPGVKPWDDKEEDPTPQDEPRKPS